MINWNFMFYNPTRILFGKGQLENLHREKLPGKKALLLISNGSSVKANGSLAQTEEQLKKAGIAYAIFNGIIENPLNTTVMEAAAFAKEQACDFIVALGGARCLIRQRLRR